MQSGNASKGKKQRALIADLPRGVSCYRDGGYIRVRLGKLFTGTGEVKKKNFTDLASAKKYVFGEESRRAKESVPGVIDLKKDLGSTAFDVPRGVYAEATAAWKELRAVKSPGGILEAVRFYIKHTSLTEGTWTIDEAASALDKSLARKNRDERYRKGIAWAYRRFSADFGNAGVHEVSKSDILDWLDEEDFSAITRNNYIRDLKLLFNYAEAERRLGLNPMREIRREEVPDGAVTILTVRQAARLVLAASLIPGMLAGTAIKLFAGLRTSEVRRLDWKEVKREMIVVEAKKAKTRSRRAVTIPENLLAWLAGERRESGPVWPSGREWRTAFELLREASGLEPWPRNCQRHSFGSYHLAKFRNENLTASEMGNSPDIIVRHYRAVIDDPKEIENYWAISPVNARDLAKTDDKFEETLAGLEK